MRETDRKREKEKDGERGSEGLREGWREKEGGRGMEGRRVGRRWENGERKFTSGREKLKSRTDNGEKACDYMQPVNPGWGMKDLVQCT